MLPELDDVPDQLVWAAGLVQHALRKREVNSETLCTPPASICDYLKLSGLFGRLQINGYPKTTNYFLGTG